MHVIDIIDYDIVNYKKPSLFIGTSKCDGKCNIDAGKIVCQNYALYGEKTIAVPDDRIIQMYDDNPMTHAIVIGGLEPFDTYHELYAFIKEFRRRHVEEVVIYTGYNADEIRDYVDDLTRDFMNLIIKFGRYVEGNEPHFDKVLGVNLASDNQYAERIW